jgi:hypothetical protein
MHDAGNKMRLKELVLAGLVLCALIRSARSWPRTRMLRPGTRRETWSFLWIEADRGVAGGAALDRLATFEVSGSCQGCTAVRRATRTVRAGTKRQILSTSTTLALLVSRFLRGASRSESIVGVEAVRRGRGSLA